MATLTLAVPLSASPLSFDVDAAGQVEGNRTFRAVANTWARGGWYDQPSLPANWAVQRFEGTIDTMADWWELSNPRTNFTVTPDGEYEFKPAPGMKIALEQWARRAGVRPLVVMATNTIPAPLIEGDYQEGQYGYNIRQPKDYAKWQRYIESALQWLIDTYGREEVKTWGFMFGIESDWQARALYPGTAREMSVTDNRREYVKMLDYFHAACAAKLGPSAYVGCYWAIEAQAEDYISHWAEGVNYATGKRGTRIAFCGFSDWTYVGSCSLNPFDPAGRNRRDANGYIAGLVGKYTRIAALIDRYPSLRGLEVNLPEAGYFDPRGGVNQAGGECPADVAYADHHGTALYAMRTAAYAACPRLRWAWNRFALGTGDLRGWYADDVKAPVFHALRIEKKLAGQRLLPVTCEGTPQDPGNDVRVVAVAADDDSSLFRIVVTSLSERFDAGTVEPLRLRLSGLPDVDRVCVTQYLVDAEHNNWWPDWKRYREQSGIPYVAGPNSGHLGTRIRYKPEYAAYHQDIMGTMSDADLPRWLAKVPEYRARDRLVPTAGPNDVTVRLGSAEIAFDVQPHAVMYLEITASGRSRSGDRDLAFTRASFRDWEATGGCRPVDCDRVPEGSAARLTAAGGARLARTLTGLEPGAGYTVTALAKASGRVLDYGLSAGPPNQPQQACGWGDYSARWNRIVVTAVADSAGNLAVSLQVPAAPADGSDHVLFAGLELRRNR
jgi:hypothetical protein